MEGQGTDSEESLDTLEKPSKQAKLTASVPSENEEDRYRALQEKVSAYMPPWRRMYNIRFEELIDIDADLSGETLDGTVAAVIMDPPYNTRSARNSPNSEDDNLTLEDMQRRCASVC